MSPEFTTMSIQPCTGPQLEKCGKHARTVVSRVRRIPTSSIPRAGQAQGACVPGPALQNRATSFWRRGPCYWVTLTGRHRSVSCIPRGHAA